MARTPTGTRRRILWLAVTVSIGIAGTTNRADASTIDLGHPSLTPFLTAQIEALPGDDRGVVFTALSTFTIASAGVVIDPLQPAAVYTLAVDIYSSGIGGGPQSQHGALLASASAAFSDAGLGFYDIPIAFTFQSGQIYDIAFRSVSPFTWGTSITYQMELYQYADGMPGGPYIVGPVSVRDGACHPSLNCGLYSNGAMSHVRLDAEVQTTPVAAPEPATLWLFGAGAVGLSRRYMGRRARGSR